MKRYWVVLAIALAVQFLTPAQGRVEPLSFDSPAQEQRYRKLIAELRCLVCQNQNLADSNADLAQDLRQITYDMIKSGASDAEIINYMVARYGEFVLYRPPLTRNTALLWIGPFVLLGVGIIVLVVVARRRARAQPEPVTASDRERVRELLEQEPERTTPE